MCLEVGFRLVVDRGMITFVFENRRGDLSAQIAIDAGIVDEEGSFYVFRISTVGISHTLILKQCINLRDPPPVTLLD